MRAARTMLSLTPGLQLVSSVWTEQHGMRIHSLGDLAFAGAYPLGEPLEA